MALEALKEAWVIYREPQPTDPPYLTDTKKQRRKKKGARRLILCYHITLTWLTHAWLPLKAVQHKTVGKKKRRLKKNRRRGKKIHNFDPSLIFQTPCTFNGLARNIREDKLVCCMLGPKNITSLLTSLMSGGERDPTVNYPSSSGGQGDFSHRETLQSGAYVLQFHS